MKRHYYVSDDLDDLERVERDLEAAGVATPQIHILSEDDSGIERRGLHNVEAVLKKDVVNGTERGAVIGIVGAGMILAIAWLTGLTATYTWVPAIFLAVVVLGFCTWEGGLIGIQKPHAEFRRFQNDLRQGKYILFVDSKDEQQHTLQQVIKEHPKLQDAGQGEPTPGWVVGAQQKWTRFLQLAP